MSSFPEPDAVPEREGMPEPDAATPPQNAAIGHVGSKPEMSTDEQNTVAVVLAHGEHLGLTVTNFVRNSPFLCASLVVHIIVLMLLAMITARETVTVQRRPALLMEELEADDIQMLPMQKEINLSHAGGAIGIPGVSGGGNEGYEGARGDTPQVNVPNISILGLEAPTGAGTGGDFDGHGQGDFNLAPGMGGKSVGGAVDQFAIITLNCMARGKTLVALIIDRSASILYGDLPRVIERMDHYFDEINMNLPRNMEEVGRWVVVSYGDTPKVECEPTCNLEQLKAALRNVQSERSGKENIGLAVESVVNAYGNKDYDFLLIAAMTDEAGDDIENPVILERTIGRLRAAKARFYVFGYESTFCARDKWVSIPVSQLKGKDLQEYQAYADATEKKLTDFTISGWARGGPESPRPELWWTENWDAWRHWGGSYNNIPSGFGMYGLNRMALATGGIYFLLKPESSYNEEKLYSTYKPDICSVFTYKKRMETPLRQELTAIWRELGYFHLASDLRDAKQVDELLKKSLAGRRYCAERSERLKALLSKAETGANAGRWEAHGDVTLAELYRFRFMLGQYHEVLRVQWQKLGQKIPEGKRLLMQKGKAPDDFVGPELAKQEYDAAVQYIQRASEKHNETPWQVMAGRLRPAVFPWKCVLADLPKPPPPSAAPPPSSQPPSIGL